VKLVTAILAKNEADHYLRRVLARCLEFSDKVLVLDDRSTDGTAQVAKEMGCQVRGRSVLAGDAWGKESLARQELWNWAAEEAGDGWVLFNDADMLLQGDVRSLCYSWEASAFAFILYDVWSEDETQYRCDGFWQAHLTPRPWLVKPKAVLGDAKPVFSRDIHCGHLPQNANLGACLVAPPDTYYWLHLGWATAANRKVKYERYMEVSHLLTDFEKAHVQSILV